MPLRRASIYATAAAFVLVCLAPAPARSADPPTIEGPNRVFTTEGTAITFTGLNPRAGVDTNNDPEKLEITVDLETAGCAPAPGNNYSLSGCSSLTIGADVGEGSLSMDYNPINGQASVVGQTPAGAFVASYAAGQIRLNGTNTQLNDSLKTLTWTPVANYENDDETTSEITLLGSNAVGSGSVNEYIQVRVDDENQPMTLTVPGDQTMDTAVDGQTKSFPAVPPAPPGTNGLWFVEDPDIEEGDPSFGLVVNVATCGRVSLLNNLTIQGTLTDVLRGYVDDLHNGDDTDGDYITLRDGFVNLLINALPDEVKNAPFETGQATDPHVAWAGMGTLSEINYALSQVTFHAPATVPNTCDIITVVSDLGNDGLPFQYVGSPITDGDNDDPEFPEPGIELPEPSLDLVAFDSVTIEVDGGASMVSLPPALSVPEGSDLSIPVSVDGVHPAFDVSLLAADVSTEGALDYNAPTDASFAGAPGAASANGTLAALTDAVFPEGDETLTLTLDEADLPAGVMLDPAAAQTTVTITDVPPGGGDTTRPTVTVSPQVGQDNPTSIAPIRFTVQFSEPVTGFDDTDPQFAGSTAGGPLTATVIPVDGDTYTVEVLGMNATGDVVLSLLADAAMDPSGNTSEAPPSTATVAWVQPPPGDTTRPTVTVAPQLGQPSPTSVAPIRFTVQFSEPVSGFDDTDPQFAGSTAGGPLTATVLPVDGDTYTVEVLGMNATGDVVLSLLADAATDASGNTSEAPPSAATVAWVQPPPGDTTRPTVTVAPQLGQPSPTSVAPVRFTVQFSEPVAGFDDTDPQFAGSTAGGPLTATVIPVDTDTYTVEVMGMSATGDVVLSLLADAAMDPSGNTSEAPPSAATVAWVQPPPDTTRPTVTVSPHVGQDNPTSIAPIRFTVQFSEPVTGFDDTDPQFAGSNAGGPLTATVVPVDSDTYTVEVMGMDTTGDVVLSLLADAAVDGSGNTSEAPPSAATVAWVQPPPGDTTRPSVTVLPQLGQPSPTSVAPVRFTVQFSEPVSGFDDTDPQLTGSTAGGPLTPTVIPVDGDTYTVEVMGMDATGDVVLSLLEDAAIDASQNTSLAPPASATVAWLQPPPGDTTRPSVTIAPQLGQPSPTSTSPIRFRVQFSEAVTGFEAADVSLAGSSAGGPLTADVVAIDADTYTVRVTGMDVDGDVVASVPDDVAADAASNLNTAAPAPATVAWLNPDPDADITVTINQAPNQPDPTSKPPIRFLVVFNAPVVGFSASDLDLGASTAGGSLVAKVQSGNLPGVFKVRVTGMTTTGDVVATIPANAVDPKGRFTLRKDVLASTSTDNVVRWVKKAVSPGGNGNNGNGNGNGTGDGDGGTDGSGGLPGTGGPPLMLLPAGVLLVLAGGALVVGSRRRRSVS